MAWQASVEGCNYATDVGDKQQRQGPADLAPQSDCRWTSVFATWPQRPGGPVMALQRLRKDRQRGLLQAKPHCYIDYVYSLMRLWARIRCRETMRLDEPDKDQCEVNETQRIILARLAFSLLRTGTSAAPINHSDHDCLPQSSCSESTRCHLNTTCSSS